MKYIKGIFQYIKNKIDFGIIIIDSGKYYKPQNIQIISELHYNMNIQFLNFLFVLNKIDLVKNSETTKQKCRDYFIKKLDFYKHQMEPEQNEKKHFFKHHHHHGPKFHHFKKGPLKCQKSTKKSRRKP